MNVCLFIPVSAFLSVYLFLTSEPAHPPGQALWPVLRRRLKWAIAEMAVLRMELTVTVSVSPIGPPVFRDTLSLHKGVF